MSKFLVVARCPMDDIPLRLYDSPADARLLAEHISERENFDAANSRVPGRGTATGDRRIRFR